MNNFPYQLSTRRGEFRVTVDGDPAAPTLILGNSLGTTLEMWDPQVAVFSKSHRLIRYDTRGHGGSPVTPGPYRFEDLGHDVLAVLDALQVERAAFCGISMGGHTGLWLGIHAGLRFNAIAVSNSAAKIGTEQAWRERAAMVRSSGTAGMQGLAESAPGRWFTPGFIQDQPAVVQCAQQGIARIDPEGYAACCEALATSDLRTEIARIAVPTLVIAGEFDPVTTVADAEAIQTVIVGASLATVPASHLSNLEVPTVFNKVLADFLDRH
jgi:3-oxoadipate enol-lactonase